MFIIVCHNDNVHIIFFPNISSPHFYLDSNYRTYSLILWATVWSEAYHDRLLVKFLTSLPYALLMDSTVQHSNGRIHLYEQGRSNPCGHKTERSKNLLPKLFNRLKTMYEWYRFLIFCRSSFFQH